MYSLNKNMFQVIKIKFYQIVTEMWGHQKWQFDKMWFYKLLCDSLLNSLLQTWFLRLPIGQEIGTGVPIGKSLIVTPSIWRGPPIVHMKRQTPPTFTEKWISHRHGGEDAMIFFTYWRIYMYEPSGSKKIKETTNLQNIDFARQKTRLSTIELLFVQN